MVIALLTVTCCILLSQATQESHKETAVRYLEAYAKADTIALGSVVHREYRHYVFDIPKEDFDGLIQLVRKKGKVGEFKVHENIGCKDFVIIRWTFLNPPDEFGGISLFAFKDGKIAIEREYYKKMEGP